MRHKYINFQNATILYVSQNFEDGVVRGSSYICCLWASYLVSYLEGRTQNYTVMKQSAAEDR